MKEITGDADADPAEFAESCTENYEKMLEIIRSELDLTSLKYQKLDDLVESIGLPKEKLCTYCWDGAE